MPMAEQQKESSVLFSLKELMNLEEDRIREEEAQKEAQAKAELEARQAAERTARQAEEARLRSEEEARRVDEQRRKEEATRLDAIRQGELERARADAEHRARLEAMNSQQAHEQTIAALTQDKHKKRLQVVVGITVGVLLIVGVGGGIAIKQNLDDSAKEKALHIAQQKETEERLRRLQNDFDTAARREQELQASLANSKDEATRAKLQAELEQQRQRTQAAGKAVKSGAGSDSAPKKKASNCAPGDPLCD
jgi:colicin import membrane protein